MPEYVYALHDFLPENEDELTFTAGDRIEVVEKDDMYGDGWWQGRNLAGKRGLFPVSYTTPAAPPAVPISNPIPEESESGSPRPEVESYIIAPIPKQGLPSFLNGNHDFAEENGVMKATLTDVQQAIEQLGRDHGDNDGGRSFSFASTRDDRDTDTDFDLSDIDGNDATDDLEGWHKGARMKLAEKARRAVEEAEKLDAMMGGLGINSERRTAPPIEVEMSDESDEEVDRDNYTTRSVFQGIPEEDEEEAEVPTVPTSIPASPLHQSITFDLPEKDDKAATATRSTFPSLAPQKEFNTHPQQENEAEANNNGPFSIAEPTRTTSSISSSPPPSSTPLSHVLQSSKHSSIVDVILLTGTTSSSPVVVPPSDIPPPKSPSPPPPTPPTAATVVPPPHPVQPIEPPSTTNLTSFPTISSPIATPSPSSAPTIAPTTAPPSVEKKKEKSHPSEWSLEDVLDWLKSKGFDQDVCDKFTEQEITGDVLLELDVNLLKSEIGIMAFGKRVRISNAIADLRRPPSISYSDRPEPSPMATHTPITPLSQVHSRTQSQSHSHHSFPGNNLHHTYSQSIQSSLASPLGFPGGNNIFVYPNPSNGNANLPYPTNATMQPGSAGGFIASPVLVESPLVDVGGEYTIPREAQETSGNLNGNGNAVGLGIANGGFLKPRPTQLFLSPSDGALKTSATVDALAALQPRLIKEEVEDRGHMSDGDVAPKSMRRKLFGRSQDSTSSSFRLSKDMSPVASPKDNHEKEEKKDKEKEKEKDKDSNSASSLRHGKSKKSLDVGKGSDRLSIFGGTFSGSLGKNRKPPPSADDATVSEKSSMFSRLHSGSVRKTSTHQPHSSTPTGSSKTTPTIEESSPKQEKIKTNKDSVRDPAILRKRTSPTSPTIPSAINKASTVTSKSSTLVDSENATTTGVDGQKFKPGKSILGQIGVPDHSGWMRKRGDRYNSWKNRYFVLKGSHMYCLRSDSKSETKIKGYIHIVGYKVSVDENLDPGRYGFRIDHDNDKTHYFSSDEKAVVRDWMKAIMKATIDRDYSRPVVSSCNIPTIPLTVAQAMNPAPRPPSPGARAATQRSYMREDTNQLSTRDAQVLSIGLTPPASDVGRSADSRELGDDFPSTPKVGKTIMTSAGAPPRPSREMRRSDSVRSSNYNNNNNEVALIEWANTHLPLALQITNSSGSLYSGLAILRLAESIKGKPSSPPVSDSAFPQDQYDDKLDGLFRLFDFLLDNEVRMGSVSINDIKTGKRDKILQLLRALRSWEEKRKALVHSLSTQSGKSVSAGVFIAPASWS